MWLLWVLAALSPSLVIVVCAWFGLERDKRRARRRAAMQGHPASVGRRLAEERVVREAEDIVRSAS